MSGAHEGRAVVADEAGHVADGFDAPPTTGAGRVAAAGQAEVGGLEAVVSALAQQVGKLTGVVLELKQSLVAVTAATTSGSAAPCIGGGGMGAGGGGVVVTTDASAHPEDDHREGAGHKAFTAPAWRSVVNVGDEGRTTMGDERTSVRTPPLVGDDARRIAKAGDEGGSLDAGKVAGVAVTAVSLSLARKDIIPRGRMLQLTTTAGMSTTLHTQAMAALQVQNNLESRGLEGLQWSEVVMKEEETALLMKAGLPLTCRDVTALLKALACPHTTSPTVDNVFADLALNLPCDTVSMGSDPSYGALYLQMAAERVGIILDVVRRRTGTTVLATSVAKYLLQHAVPTGVVDLMTSQLASTADLAATMSAGITLPPCRADYLPKELHHGVSLLRLLADFCRTAMDGGRYGGAAPRVVQGLDEELRAGWVRMVTAIPGATKPAVGTKGGGRAAAGGSGVAGVNAVSEEHRGYDDGHRRGGGGKGSHRYPDRYHGGTSPGAPWTAPTPSAAEASDSWRQPNKSQTASPTTLAPTTTVTTASSAAVSTSSSSTRPIPGQRFPVRAGMSAESPAPAPAPSPAPAPAPAPAAAGSGNGIAPIAGNGRAPVPEGEVITHEAMAAAPSPSAVQVHALGSGVAFPCRALMDTGSKFNVLDARALKRMQDAGVLVEDGGDGKWSLRSATSHEFTVLGCVKLTLRMPDGLEEQAKFVVVANELDWDIILHHGVALPYFRRMQPVEDVVAGVDETPDDDAAVVRPGATTSWTPGEPKLDMFSPSALERAVDAVAKTSLQEVPVQEWHPLTEEVAEMKGAAIAAALERGDLEAVATQLATTATAAQELLQARVGDALDRAETTQLLWLLARKWAVFVPHARGLKDELFEIALADESSPPIYVRAGDRLAPGKAAAALAMLTRLVDAGMAEWVNDSAWALPYHLVPKANGGWRMVIDGRELNSRLKRVPDLGADAPDTRAAAALPVGVLNTTVDMRQAFYQIRAGPVASMCCTLQAPPGAPKRFMRLNVMAMGVETAPDTFQRAAVRMFDPLVQSGRLFVYLDDMWLRTRAPRSDTASTPEPLAPPGTVERRAQFMEHLHDLHCLLELAIENGAFLDLTKGQYAAQAFRLLGRVQGPDGRILAPSRVEALREMGVPRTVPQLRTWLGIVGSMSEYGATPVEPLRVLLDLLAATQGKGGVGALWGDREQAAYDAIMERLDHHIALQPLDRTRPVEIEVDASASGWGAVYKQAAGEQYALLGLHAQQWTPAQRTLTNTQREFAAVVAAVQHIYPLTGVTPLVVCTDHQNSLAFFADPEAAAHPMLQRWANLLAFYPVEVRYKSGKELVAADNLSRWPWTAPPPMPIATVVPAERKYRAEGVVMEVTTGAEVTTEPREAQLIRYATFFGGGGETGTDVPMLAELKAAQQQELRDGALPDGLQGQRRGGINLLASARGRTYVPATMRHRLLRQVHENEAHVSAKTMCKRLREAGLEWPTMDADAVAHERSCHVCQRFAAGDEPAHHATLGTRGEVRPRQWLLADHAGPYALPGGHRMTLLVMVDHATRYCVIKVVPDTSAKTTWRVLLTAWFTVHGPPQKLLTDRGSAFDNAVVEKGCAELGITQLFGVRAADQGRVERLNAEIGAALRRLNIKSLDTAEEVVARVTWVLNTRRHRSIGMSPFTALHGVAPRSMLQALMGDDPGGPVVGPELAHMVETAELLVRLRSERAFAMTKATYDKRVEEWTPADNTAVLVWSPSKDRKLAPHWKGPMKVLGMHNERVARVLDPASGRELLRHVSHLREYDASRTSPEAALDFDLPDGYYMVEKVMDHRAKPRHEVLIHWANTEPEEDTWEPLSSEDIRNNTLVREFCRERGIRMPPVRHRRITSDDDDDTEA